ncbi:MAG: DUF3575 domain-containing protein [Bacteroidetes bacterium]|nr:MAG: DUF3575 domain-containing protein [Bacteroidota bacterium]
MKRTLLISLFALAGLVASAQTNETKNARVHAFVGSLNGIEWGNEYGYFGGGFGLSAGMGKHWALNTEFGFYGRDIKNGSGYIDRNVFDMRGSVDFYFSRAFRGFYVGAFMGYTNVKSTVYEGANPIASPNSFVPMGFQLGFSAPITNRLDLNLKTAVGSQPGGPGALTLNAGIGYRF